MINKGIFQIQVTDQFGYWAKVVNGHIVICRRSHDEKGTDEILAQWDTETLRSLVLWAEDQKSVTFSFTGPLANQIRELSKELSLTPEMFVWHAVKVFIETTPEG
tara:strand:- start:426 stop:740 length:315 start_codon:yes stop_codon:yes gene_type:complete